jgi:hypothetical protein
MDEWLIWVNECLPEYIGVSLPEEKQIEMAKDLHNSSQCLADMRFEMCGGRSSKPEIDYKKLYEIEKSKNETLENENRIYLGSVCRRNKVEPSDVYFEGDSVMIRK